MNNLTVINDICIGTKLERQEAIECIEEALLTLPQVELPVTHYIHGGLYGREITIPAGTVITGQLYKFDHFDIMISGDITVTTDTGLARRLKGYNCFKAFTGKRRVAYAHEDTVWLTFHSTPPRAEGEEIQKFLTCKTYTDYLNLQRHMSRQDFKKFVRSIGLTEEEVREISEVQGNQRPMPEGYDSIYIAKSLIEGQGVFSSLATVKDSIICPTVLEGKRTPAGRFTNHSVCANTRMELNNDGSMDLIALRDIEAKEEFTVNYRQVLGIQGVLCPGQ